MNTVERIKGIIERHGMTVEDAAAFLGVPKPTLIKWLNGTRTPSASADRLIEVLGIVETFAPGIYEELKEGNLYALRRED